MIRNAPISENRRLVAHLPEGEQQDGQERADDQLRPEQDAVAAAAEQQIGLVGDDQLAELEHHVEAEYPGQKPAQPGERLDLQAAPEQAVADGRPGDYQRDSGGERTDQEEHGSSIDDHSGCRRGD
ncbi:MAG: hypothetical protein U0521_04370 [Anaerolineae bacterium]